MKISKHCVACGGKDIRRSPAILMPFMAARIFGWEPADVTEAWGMRDLKPGTAYSVCSSMICDDCGMLFLDMRFDGEEMGALYDDYRGEAYSRLRDRFEPGYLARNAILLDGSPYLRTIEAFLSSHVPVRPRVLDWGGDSGVNTPFRETAAVHHIYDISGRPVIDGAVTVGLADIGGDDYDLIVFANVLEHVANPREAMAEIAAAMTPS
ncbi:MAG: methyltransferase domain-containing protein, partial [Alsobacter sp.]